MEPDLSIFCRLNSDKRSVVNFRDPSEYLSLAWPRFTMNQDVRGTHRLPYFTINFTHSVLVADSLRNDPFGFLLWYYMFIESRNKFRWCPIIIHISFHFRYNFSCFIFSKSWQSIKLKLVRYFAIISIAYVPMILLSAPLPNIILHE